jgi:hypothetical protein
MTEQAILERGLEHCDSYAEVRQMGLKLSVSVKGYQ